MWARSPPKQLVRHFVNTMFISNYQPTFHLWWKKNLVKHRKVLKYYETNCRSKDVLVFVFYLWRHFLTNLPSSAANFVYNTSLSRNTRFLISGQSFNQSLRKLLQMESTYFETLKLQKKIVKCLLKGVKQPPIYEVIFQSSSKHFQSNISQPNNRNFTFPAICIFKRSNPAV